MPRQETANRFHAGFSTGAAVIAQRVLPGQVFGERATSRVRACYLPLHSTNRDGKWDLWNWRLELSSDRFFAARRGLPSRPENFTTCVSQNPAGRFSGDTDGVGSAAPPNTSWRVDRSARWWRGKTQQCLRGTQSRASITTPPTSRTTHRRAGWHLGGRQRPL